MITWFLVIVLNWLAEAVVDDEADICFVDTCKVPMIRYAMVSGLRSKGHSSGERCKTLQELSADLLLYGYPGVHIHTAALGGLEKEPYPSQRRWWLRWPAASLHRHRYNGFNSGLPTRATSAQAILTSPSVILKAPPQPIWLQLPRQIDDHVGQKSICHSNCGKGTLTGREQ